MSTHATRMAISRFWRIINALCYLGSGIALIALGGQAAIILMGVAFTLYGLYVGLSNRGYIVGTWTYLLPIVGIALLAAR